jgi:hypothetical protein
MSRPLRRETGHRLIVPQDPDRYGRSASARATDRSGTRRPASASAPTTRLTRERAMKAEVTDLLNIIDDSMIGGGDNLVVLRTGDGVAAGRGRRDVARAHEEEDDDDEDDSDYVEEEDEEDDSADDDDDYEEEEEEDVAEAVETAWTAQPPAAPPSTRSAARPAATPTGLPLPSPTPSPVAVTCLSHPSVAGDTRIHVVSQVTLPYLHIQWSIDVLTSPRASPCPPCSPGVVHGSPTSAWAAWCSWATGQRPTCAASWASAACC